MRVHYLRALKLKIGLVLFFLSTTLFAYIPGLKPNLLAGFSMGYVDLKGSARTTLTYAQGVPLGFQNLIVRDYSDHKIFPSVFIGYQAQANCVLFGIELNADWQNMTRTLNFAFADSNNLVGWNGAITYDRKMVYGLTARIGYSFTSFLMPYVRLGVETSDDELHAEYRDFNNTVVFQQDPHVETWVYRFLFGVGAEMPLPTCLPISLRMEVDYSSKGKTLGAAAQGFGGVFPILDAELQPRAISGRIGVVWNFL